MSRVKWLRVSLLFLLLLMYSTIRAAEYTIPCAAWSVYAGDLDLDGDNDIVVGHNYNIQSEWSGISFLENNGTGYFTMIDSIFLYAWQPDVQIKNLNLNELPEIIAKYYDSEEENEYIAIINDFNFYDISYFSLNTYEGVGYITSGDIDNDNYIDIIVASNNGFFWGYLLNNGIGEFLSPEYYDLSFPPNGLACGDLNGEGGDEIVVSGEETYMYSYPINPNPLVLDSINYNIRVSIADMDNDGDNDVIGYEYNFFLGWTFFRIYENLGNDNFLLHEIVYEFGLSEFLITDVNKDSLPDILGCEYVLYNEGNLNLSEPSYYTLFYDSLYAYHYDFFCSDLDGNEYADMIAIRYFGQSTPSLLNIVFNDGNGNFVQEPQVGADPQYPPISEVSLTIYPNPFKINSMINFSIKEHGLVELKIYDIKGRLIKQVINQKLKGGEHSVVWNGRDENNRCCSSGIYLMDLKLNGVSKKVKKVIMLK